MDAWIHQRYNGGSSSNTWPETAISESETLLAGGSRQTIIIMPTATKNGRLHTNTAKGIIPFQELPRLSSPRLVSENPLAWGNVRSSSRAYESSHQAKQHTTRKPFFLQRLKNSCLNNLSKQTLQTSQQ